MIFNNLTIRLLNSKYNLCAKKSYNYYYYRYYNVCYFSTTTTDIKQPSIYEFLVEKHNFSPQVASHIASALSPSVLRNHESSDSILSFLKHDIGLTKSQLEKTFKLRPRLLFASLDKIIKPKIKILQNFGFSSTHIADIISRGPGILHASVQNTLVPGLSSLEGLIGSNVQVVKVLRKSGWLLVINMEKTVKPNIEYFKSRGISMKQIIMCFKHFPRFFVHKPELMRKYSEKVINELGVDESSKMFIYAVGVVSSMSNRTWDMKLEAFRNVLGYSNEDISRVFKQNPQVFKVSEDQMKRVKQVILGTGKYKASCIVECPHCVNYSVEKRFKPRFRVLEILESGGVIQKWPCLGKICRTTDAKFFQEFVGPYSDLVGHVYNATAYKPMKESTNRD